MKRFCLTTVLFVLIGLFINTNNLFSCQCPSNIQPTNVSWTSQGPDTIRIYDNEDDWCDYEVYYCWRKFGVIGYQPMDSVVEIWICDYDQTDSCQEDFGLDVWILRKRLAERIMVLNPDQLNWEVPPCTYPSFPNFATYLFSCWDGAESCGSVYCKYSYWLRICGGQILVDPIGYEQIGGSCVPPCTSHCGD